MPGFCGLDNDVFISYAHADNTEGWITAFETQLTNRLRQLDRDAPFNIWRDKKLTGADVFSDEINTRLKSSGVLISILSPNGLDSDWCQRERKSFEQSAARNGGLHLNNKTRTLRITKSPCKNNKDRDLFGTLGHDFYRPAPQTGFFQEINHHSADFEDKLLLIAQEVLALLKDLRERRLQTPAPELTVYLAAPPPNTTAAQWRQRVTSELTGAWNCRVLPENPDPDELSKSSITALINGSDLSFHWETAAAQSRPLTDTFQWECALAAPSIKRVICEVAISNTNPAPPPPTSSSNPNDERIRATAPDEIIQYFEDFIKARRNAPAPNPAGQRPLVYVICAPDEIEDAIRLKQCLENESRFAAILPIRDTTDGKARLADHRNWLKTCQHALLYWGRSSQHSWFREQQREIIAAQVKRKAHPLRALCLAVSNTADPSSDSLPNLPLQKIASVECAIVRSHIRNWEPEQVKVAFSL